jgi:protein-S-isoprenylcysteine O-methyltransferase Ste14
MGVTLILLGTGLTYWAQTSSSKAGKIKTEENNTEGFAIGPYKHFRNPTYFGLFIMTLGFGLLINSLFSVLFVLIAYLVIKRVFIKKEEMILTQKYGEIYKEYKRKVNDLV